jgi:hypothetical protein
MTIATWPGNTIWPQWQKILFRFFFIYFCLLVIPWICISLFGNYDFVSSFDSRLESWLINAANHYLFNTYEKLSQGDSSGLTDNSYGWTEVRLYFIVALLVCVFWTLLDRKRNNYNFLSYWFRILLRYFLIAMLIAGYGIDKIFHLQMPYPNLAQLSMPLGDYFPQGLEWLSMGYATKYQVFTGIVETLAGLLMFFRRTATFGTLMALGAFTIVFMTNIGYDIVVKLFSLHLIIMCLILLSYEYRRIAGFLLNNTTVSSNKLYKVSFSNRWIRIARILLKCYFFWQILILTAYNDAKIYFESQKQVRTNPITPGIYSVPVFVVNGDTLPPLLTDSLRWQKVVFNNFTNKAAFNDVINNGYVIPYDTIFSKRFDRGFFSYSIDTVKHEIQFMKSKYSYSAPYSSFLMKYELPDSNTILLNGIIREASVSVVLKNTHRHFILTDSERPWLKEDGWFNKFFEQQ